MQKIRNRVACICTPCLHFYVASSDMQQQILVLKKMLPMLCALCRLVSIFLLLAIAPFVFASLSLLLQPTKFVKGFLQDKPVLKISFLQEKNLRGIDPNLRRQLMRLICCQFWLCLSLLELELCQLWLCLCTLNLELLSTFATSVVLTYTGTGLLPTSVAPIFTRSGIFGHLSFSCTCLG